MRANVFFDGKINGTISFHQINRSRPVEVEIELSGLQKNHLHGLHIHENADLTNHCMNTGGHFNPNGKQHGEHAGDLIHNIVTDDYGNVNLKYSDSNIALYPGKNNIIGRSVVIHQFADDKGKFKFYEKMNDSMLFTFAKERKYISGKKDFNRDKVLQKIKSESRKSGNAGPRIACGVIQKK